MEFRSILLKAVRLMETIVTAGSDQDVLLLVLMVQVELYALGTRIPLSKTCFFGDLGALSSVVFDVNV